MNRPVPFVCPRVEPCPFESGEVDRAVAAGQDHQVLGRYEGQEPRGD